MSVGSKNRESMEQVEVAGTPVGMVFSELRKAIAYVDDHRKFIYGSD